MEPTAEITADFWKRFRAGQKSLEKLAEEQGYRAPKPGDPPIVGFMDDEEWEAFNKALLRWRGHDENEIRDEDRTNMTHDIPMRRFTRSKSVEQLIAEQCTQIPETFEGYLADIMPEDQTPEAWNARIEGWREEDRRRTNP